jgi:hypothetical protein
MFASLKFRDVFSFPAVGLAPQQLATGSIQGSAIPVAGANATSAGPAGNYANFGKWGFLVQLGSGAVTTRYNAWIGGASVSNGTFSMLPASSTSLFSGSATYSQAQGYGGTSVSGYGSAGAFWMEIRGEYLNGLNSGITYIAPIVSVTGASGTAAIASFAFSSEQMQASLYDIAYILQETDSF